ncbi:hypothetical protein [Clostridium felsineum]|nr:hypothetical protein [Clostridium felsineum]URZ16299.1 hypothetical protein CLFE_023460 [Clostridium felsineum DSM 794]
MFKIRKLKMQVPEDTKRISEAYAKIVAEIIENRVRKDKISKISSEIDN